VRSVNVEVLTLRGVIEVVIVYMHFITFPFIQISMHQLRIPLLSIVLQQPVRSISVVPNHNSRLIVPHHPHLPYLDTYQHTLHLCLCKTRHYSPILLSNIHLLRLLLYLLTTTVASGTSFSERGHQASASLKVADVASAHNLPTQCGEEAG
jgi:hypothetical protein